MCAPFFRQLHRRKGGVAQSAQTRGMRKPKHGCPIHRAFCDVWVCAKRIVRSKSDPDETKQQIPPLRYGMTK
ncbi:hypothetical protein AciPR4_4020 [Terriglobus saanensis SP1PR4]|uniref:Uncharacterized protein n=1 Tax=Terriglobus saanensis (strain ATCC BAA-1853 / DSM 23119 / SP1PR4) TaxID=401053 RepID=E8V3T2_TERSS|nr:hypothetical protein AciPR4_4020 [Terriglobus saanensis SP1PR4]